MKEIVRIIPNHPTLRLRHAVLDYNGTLACDGRLKSEAGALLATLAKQLTVHVITSDTFGTVREQLSACDVTIKVLESGDHTGEKAEYIRQLGADGCAAVGNGSNDAQMLEAAALGIAVIGEEGCSSRALMQSDVICTDIADALALLVNENRLVATLRR